MREDWRIAWRECIFVVDYAGLMLELALMILDKEDYERVPHAFEVTSHMRLSMLAYY